MPPPFPFLFTRIFCQRFIFVAICLATVTALFYLIEDVRGEAAWKRYREKAAGRGSRIDMATFIPPAIPDEENFAAAPLFKELSSADPAVHARAERACFPPWRDVPHRSDSPDHFDGYRSPINLPSLQRALVKAGMLTAPTENPALDVLRVLEANEPLLAQLRQAATRPRSRMPVHWERGMRAEIYDIGSVVPLWRLLSLRITALLDTGRDAEAMTDWRLMLRLTDAFKSEPTLLAAMIRVLGEGQIRSMTEYGLGEEKWTDPELAEMEEALGKVDLVADALFGIETDRALQNSFFDAIKSQPQPNPFDPYMQYLGRDAEPFIAWSPVGWLDQNQVRLNECYDGVVQTMHEAHGLAPTRFPEIPDLDPRPNPEPSVLLELTRDWRCFLRPYTTLRNRMIYMMGPQVNIAAVTQTMVTLCRVACAMERYRLKNGSYPELLEMLPPDELGGTPRGAYHGEPIRLRQLDESCMLIYSVGPDGLDGTVDDIYMRLPIDRTYPFR